MPQAPALPDPCDEDRLSRSSSHWPDTLASRSTVHIALHRDTLWRPPRPLSDASARSPGHDLFALLLHD
eukprot:5084228-Lingulodinium_polyedra.AAC.1